MVTKTEAAGVAAVVIALALGAHKIGKTSKKTAAFIGTLGGISAYWAIARYRSTGGFEHELKQIQATIDQAENPFKLTVRGLKGQTAVLEVARTTTIGQLKILIWGAREELKDACLPAKQRLVLGGKQLNKPEFVNTTLANYKLHECVDPTIHLIMSTKPKADS